MELRHQPFPTVQPHVSFYLPYFGAGKDFFWWKRSVAHLEVAEPEQVEEILNSKDGNYLKSELPSFIQRKSLGTDLWQLGMMKNGLICANWAIMLSMERA